jgi:hypothetical protein
MKDEQNFEIKSHTGCLRTRWYWQVLQRTRKGLPRNKNGGLHKERGNWTFFTHWCVRYGQDDGRRKRKAFQEATVFCRCYKRWNETMLYNAVHAGLTATVSNTPHTKLVLQFNEVALIMKWNLSCVHDTLLQYVLSDNLCCCTKNYINTNSTKWSYKAEVMYIRLSVAH